MQSAENIQIAKKKPGRKPMTVEQKKASKKIRNDRYYEKVKKMRELVKNIKENL